MKSKICIGLGLLLFLITVFVYQHALLHFTAGSFLAVGMLGTFGLSHGIDYNESHYRMYTRILFWKTGEWRSIGGVRRVYLRPSVRSYSKSPSGENLVYKIYFVRRSGNYKIFSSNSLEEAREKAAELGLKYNLPVHEKSVEELQKTQ